LTCLHRVLLYADLQQSVSRVALTTEIRTSTTFVLLTAAWRVEASGCSLMVQLRQEG